MNLSKEQTPKEVKKQEEAKQNGRVIAQEIHNLKVEKEKNMAKAVKRKATMLENAAEKVLSGRA